jgi:hypothetical protein
VHFDTCSSPGITEKFMTGVMGQAVSQKNQPPGCRSLPGGNPAGK